MKVWRDKSGKWITAKEFKERFAKGVEGVTPLQQIKSQIVFSWITVIGLLCGIIVSIYNWDTLWWLIIILVAGIGNTIVGLIGIYQKKTALAQIEAIMKENEAFSEKEVVKGGKDDKK